MDAEAPIWQGESEQPPEHTRRYVRRQRSEQPVAEEFQFTGILQPGQRVVPKGNGPSSRGQMGWIGGQTGQVILRRALRGSIPHSFRIMIVED
jgi:hypothetical protein